MYYLTSMEELWKLAKKELTEKGLRKGTADNLPDDLEDFLDENSPKIYIFENRENCGSVIYLNSFVEYGHNHCSCGESYFDENSPIELERILSPFRKKEVLPISWTFGSFNQSETAES